MCGIAGSLGSRDDATRAVEAQLRTLGHRGPDSRGVHIGSRAAIGQTRLAVIDLVTGDPPILDEDGGTGVVFNGEVYNYRALQHELRCRGHTLTTEGDTEVIAHLAEDHEPVALARRLHGMFAFAVWDEARERLVLGRDRLGKKPLYYWSSGGCFVFGSEIKAVLAHPAVPREPECDALPAYLTFGYVPTPRTFFAGVRSLPPGHVLTVTPGRAPVVEQYWEPAVPGVDGAGRLVLSTDEAAAEIRRRLRRAVERRLIADVPLGAFLSGGVDSSAVVGLMAEASSTPVRTFTIGFEGDDGFDERPYARLVAQRHGTDHTEFVVKPDASEVLETLVWHHDQPFGDSSALPMYFLSELTRRQVTVALCGDGGDELFAGYERFAAALALRHFDALPAIARTSLHEVAAALPKGAFGGRVVGVQRMLARSGLGLPAAFRSWVSFLPEEWCRRLVPDGSDWGIEDYHTIWERSEGAGVLDRLLALNLRTYLLDDLLPKVDRMSMAHGLEVRSPFLDTDLVDVALRLPDRTRVVGLSLKRALKRAVADLLPPTVLKRAKHGFGVPLDRWFRHDLRSYLDGMLASSGSRLRRHVAGDAVDALLAEHQRGVANHGHALWTLLTLEVFLRREGW
jgi:asparagine synthase (glutamine-hydrolysing)